MAISSASVENVAGLDNTSLSYGETVLSFPVNFSQFYQTQNIDFELNLTASYGLNNQTEIVARYFSVDSGSLSLDTPISNTLRKNDDNQDEFHYYHIDDSSCRCPVL